MTATVSRKTAPKLSGLGSAAMCPTPRNGVGPTCRTTGNVSTKPTSASRATGVQRR